MSSTEDENLADLKDWWTRNGKPLVTGGLLALVIVFGWQAFQKYQGNQAQSASILYQQLLETTLTPDGKPDAARVSDLAGKLNSEFGGTAYAQYGSLFVAKVAVDSGKLDDAATELKAIIAKPANPALGEIARQRLAQVLAAQDKADEALKLLEGDADSAFLATREELKGDLLVKLGRTDEANAAYQKAKAALSDEAAVGGLQIKLDDLAKGMRDVIRWKHAALLALAILAAGCSSNSKKELPPAELTDFKEEVVLQKQWSRSIGDGQGETYNMLVPAIDGDTIYAADVTGVVMSMDRSNGDVKWEKDLELPVSGAVGVGYGLVMIGTLKGEIVALDASSGEEKWRARVSSEVLAPPASNGDVVVVQTQDDRLIGLDAATGNQRWLYDSTPAVLTLRGTSAPIVTNRLAVAGLSTGKVVALDISNGVPVWEQRVAIPQGRSELERVVDIDGGLLLSGGTLYVASYQGRVAALDLESGRQLWQRDASSYAGVAQGFGSVYVSLSSGTVEGVDERTTTALWTNDSLARRQLSAPEVFSSYVAVGDLEGYLHLLSQVDGRFVGRERIDSDGLRARPLVVGDMIYVYGNSGKLEALTIK